MSDGNISIKLAPDYEMKAVQKIVEDYGQGEDIITNDGYFPDLKISDFRNQTRIDGTVTTTRLKDALIEAMATVNHELRGFKADHPQPTLALVESGRINGESILIQRYRRAVHCLAQANLYERYAGYDNTNDGEKKTELLQESIGQLRRDARFAVADILNKHRINADLI